MKINDLPLRDQIAIAALPGILSRPNITDGRWAARSAYRAADGMLLRMMVNAHEIRELTQRAEKAEIALEVLQSILAEIWEFLGVEGQTAAMAELRQMKAEISVLSEHSHD